MRISSEATRRNIIQAARQRFLDKGYAATTMDAIAVEAGITKQTLYRYFADKRTLFMSVIEDVMGGPEDFALPPDAAQSPAALRAALQKIAGHINQVIAEPDYVRLLRVVIAETIAQPELGKLFERGVTARSLRSLTRLFSAAKKQGLLLIGRPAITAQFFMGGFVTRIFLQGLLMQSGTRRIRRQTKQELSEYIDEFMRGVSAGAG